MSVSAQQLSLGKTPFILNKSAVLDLNADNQGLLLPRIADTAAINLLTPPDGMIIYSVPMKQLLLRANGFWQPLPVSASLSNYWAISGNSNGSVKKFGNTDNLDLPFITNNLERMRLTAGGFLGLGTTAPSTLLHLSGTNPLTLMGVQPGSTAATDSVLTITNGLVRKLPVAAFQQAISGTGFVKASGTTISFDNNTYTIGNTPITGGTKTKITYDSKGLVTGGADATTSDIAEGTQLYFTDARVRGTLLTGFSAATATPVTATDNMLGGIGKLQGQINSITGAGYLISNQTITLSGDVSGSGSTAITTAIGANKVTLPHLAQVATGTFLGRSATGTGNVEALTSAQAKTLLGIGGTNSGDVTLAGQNYLSLSGQTLTANAVNLSGTHVAGTLAAARFGALTGDVTNLAGSYATTIANGAVTYGKMQNISTTNRLLGRASAGAGSAEEITIGSGLSLSGTTLSATGSGMWSTSGNSATSWNTDFIGSTDNNGFRIRTNNTERLVIDSLGRVGIGISNPTNPFVIRDTMEIRRIGSTSSLLFTNTATAGDFRIGADGGDIFWQGGGGRNLQMGAFWGIVLTGDRQTAAFPSFAAGTTGVGVSIPSARAANIPLAISAFTSQTGNLTEWRNATNTAMSVVDAAGNLGLGTSAPTQKLDVAGSLRFTGALMPGGSAGTLGYVLTSAGAGTAPTWQDGNSYVTSNAWMQGGNNLAALKSLGTTSNFALPLITNNTERMRIAADGKVGIGTNNPTELLHVAGNALIGTTGQTGRLRISNSTATDVLDMYAEDNVLVKISNAGNGQTGASLQLKPSSLNYLFSFEGRGGFRYYSRVSAAETFRVDDSGELQSFGTGTNTLAGKLGVGGALSDAYSFVELKKSIAAGLDSTLLTLNSNNSGVNAGASMQFKNAGSGYLGAVASVDDGAYNGRLEFRTNTTGLKTAPLTASETKMVIKSSGNVGIANTSPAEKLDITGNLRFSGALMPGGLAGTAGYVLQSNGAGAAPTWVSPSSTGSYWNLTGNSGTTWNTHFLGTTDNKSLYFRTNNTQRFNIDSLGNVSIGTSPTFTAAPNREKFLVDAGATSSYNIMGIKGTINSYMQMNLQNRSAGAAASTDIVATADNGTETNNYVDMGINSSGYTGGFFGAANDAYLYNLGQDFLIGNGTAGKKLYFLTGGGDEATNTRMTIDGTGNVGIGTLTPAEKLDVAGNIRLSGTAAKKLVFGNMPADPDASIGLRNTTANEQQEMLFYVGNDNATAYGPDRIRMVAEEFRLQTFNDDAVSSQASAEAGVGTKTRFLINTEGNVAIGDSTFDASNPETFLVNAGVTDSYNAIKAEGTINNYLQLNIQNNSGGTVASSDVVATANNGSETANFIDMGINSGGFTDNTYPILSGINNAYLYSTGRNLLIGNASGSTYKMSFFTGGTALTNERMTILGTGNVGVGVTNPGQKLTVGGIAAPSTDNNFTLGTSGLRWSALYATNLYYTSAFSSSDRRLKMNIQSSSYGLNEVMKLQPVTYNWKDTTLKAAKVGLIAQDVRKIIPEVVNGDEAKEMLGVSYAELVPVLINAIKEQQKQIEDLKTQNAAHTATQNEIIELKKDMKAILEKIAQLEKSK